MEKNKQDAVQRLAQGQIQPLQQKQETKDGQEQASS
jgi:hypothetical protein